MEQECKNMNSLGIKMKEMVESKQIESIYLK
jgi:hypothetical protein